MVKWWSKLIHRYELYIILFCIVMLLRIPTFYEPYWYGDEAIYLALGNSIRSGEIIYKDIVDHKTPLIYYFASTGSQTMFKFIFALWMAITSCGVWYLLKTANLGRKLRIGALGIFVLLTTIPALEGNIANGELFVLGFVVFGLIVMSKTRLYQHIMNHTNATQTMTHHLALSKEWWLYLVTGLLFGGAVLTKVPAVFDLAFPGGIVILGLWYAITKGKWNLSVEHVVAGSLILLGVGVGVLASAGYFALLGALPEYLAFGWTYNFRYTEAFQINHSWAIFRFLYDTPAKMAFLAISGISLLIPSSIVSNRIKVGVFWLIATAYALLLSSRPYPHYFQQMVLPVIWLITLLISTKKLRDWIFGGFFLLYALMSLVALNLRPYPTLSYYSNFFQFIFGQMTTREYRSSFNSYVNDVYTVGDLIRTSTDPADRIFVWGTNPMLYAYSLRNPAGRFTVAFHIKDFDAHQESLDAIIETEPPVVVWMHAESDPFPELRSYLQDHYVVTGVFDTLTLYRRTSVTSLR